jgi:hypothetical protein
MPLDALGATMKKKPPKSFVLRQLTSVQPILQIQRV